MSPSEIPRSVKMHTPNYSVEQIEEKTEKFVLVIPVINEGARIINQLKKIAESKQKFDLIIVDGGSTDGSLEYFQSQKSLVTAILRLNGPGKLSAQLQIAFEYCLSKEYMGIVTMDGNDKDEISGATRIIDALSNGFDFVQGSRFVKGGISENTPLARYISIRFIHAPITSFASKHWFTDSTNGFRGFSANFLNSCRVSILSHELVNYDLVAFLPILAGRNGFKCTEVPVTRKYPKNEAIPTKINGFKGKFNLLQTLIRMSLRKPI